MAGLMDRVVLAAAAFLVAAAVLEEVSAQDTAVAVDMEGVLEGAARILPREHGMGSPTPGHHTR